MRCWVLVLPVVVLGCGEEPGRSGPAGQPAGPEVPLVLLDLTGPECSELAEATFVEGGQGGFHADLGVLVQTPAPEVAMTITVRDADTDEVLASSGEVFIGLVGWTEDEPEGWVTTRTYIGEGLGGPQDLALACAMRDRAVVVEAVVRDFVTGETATVSSVVDAAFTDPNGWCD